MSVAAKVERAESGDPAIFSSERLERLRAQAAHPICHCWRGGRFEYGAERCALCHGFKRDETGDEERE